MFKWHNFSTTDQSHALVRYVNDNIVTVVSVSNIDGEELFKLHAVYPVKFNGIPYDAIIESLSKFAL